MKKFCIHLVKDSPMALVEATAETGAYEVIAEKYEFDFVLRFTDGTEHVRIAREHILYITVDDAEAVK